MKNSASLKSIDELFWQLKAFDHASDREQLLAKIRSEHPDQAQAVEIMLANEANLGAFMALPDESGDFASGMSDRELELTLDSHPEPNTGQQTKVSATKFPKQIGPYKLLEPIGEGGMGVVYLAQQSKPVRRKVALKIIKPGMDSRQVIARFEAERQALAMMDHPNIAKVLDAGTTEAGLPFFVMELVRGIPMTDYCDRSKMPTRARLELFQDACAAIQHAHNKGVIHRDIKPSNVLVTEQDGKPLVKVIDFGVAKALTDNLTDKTLFTGMFQLLGTPLYMSPEQASLSNVDVDTRSDVYSLGVMLYELLSGSLPIDRAEVKGLSLEQLCQRICDTEPPKPSKRLSTLKDERETVAERRGVDVSRVHQLVTTELDWIVMRSIEKDRNRRYQSAREFAEDIQRYLDGDAVEACPPSTFYKLQKAYKKNRLIVIAASLIFLVLSVATGLTSWQAWQASKAEAKANQQALVATEQTEMAKGKAAEARSVVDFLVNDMIGSAVPGEQTSPDMTIKQILSRSERRIGQAFREQPLTESAIRSMIGEAYSTLGLHDAAIEQLSRAIALRENEVPVSEELLIETRRLRARALSGSNRDHERAEAELRELIRIASDAYGDRDIKTLELTTTLAVVIEHSGKSQQAQAILKNHVEVVRQSLGPTHEQTLWAILQLSISQGHTGQFLEQIKTLRRALEEIDGVVEVNRDRELFLKLNLAQCVSSTAPDECRGLVEECLHYVGSAYGKRSLLYQQCLVLKAQALEGEGDFESAINEYRKITDALKKLQSSGYECRDTLIAVNDSVAWSLLQVGRQQEALETTQENLQLSTQAYGRVHSVSASLMLRVAQYGRGILEQKVRHAFLEDGLAIYEELSGTTDLNWGYKMLVYAAELMDHSWPRAEEVLLKLKNSGIPPSAFFSGSAAEVNKKWYPVLNAYNWLYDEYMAIESYNEAEQLMLDYWKLVENDPGFSEELLTYEQWRTRDRLRKAQLAQGKFFASNEQCTAMVQFAKAKNMISKLREALHHKAALIIEAGNASIGSREDALAIIEQIFTNDPKAIDYYKSGALLCQIDRWEMADEAFAKGFALEDRQFRHPEYRVPWALAKAKLGNVEGAVATYDLASLEFISRKPEPDSWMPRYQADFRQEVGRTLTEELHSQLNLAQRKATEEPNNNFYHTAWQKLLWLSYLHDPKSVGEQHFEDARRFYEELDPAIRIDSALSLLPLCSMKGQDDRSADECVELIAQASKQIDALEPMAASCIVRLSSLHSETAKHPSLFPLAEKSSQAESPIPAHLYAMGLWELHNGTPEKAFEWFEKAQRLADESDWFEPPLAAMLSIVHHRLGDSKQADDWLAKTEISHEQVNKLHPHAIAEWVFYRRAAVRLSKQRQSERKNEAAR